MANVPKYVAATASAISFPAAAGERGADERALVRQAQGGTPEAYEALVRRHQQRVVAVISGILRRREDIEDVAQQVFLKAYLSLKRFDQRSAFATWLYKITVNECWDYLRKKKARPLLYESDLSEEQASRVVNTGSRGRQHADPSEQTELRETVERLLADLSDVDRQMLVLKEVEGFSVEEIGAIFDLNVNTVKVRMFRARGRLSRAYRRRFGEARPGRQEERKAGYDG